MNRPSDSVLDTVAAGRTSPRTTSWARTRRGPAGSSGRAVRSRRRSRRCSPTRPPSSSRTSAAACGRAAPPPSRAPTTSSPPTTGARTIARTTLTATCPRWVSSTSTSSGRDDTSSCGRCSARTCSTSPGSTGSRFAVWAPNARAVRVTGDFNSWDGAGHAMRSMGASGVWELFVPGARRGHVVQVRAPHRQRRMGPEGRSDGAVGRSARPRPRRS